MLKERFPKLVGSEYLGGAVEFGRTNERGIRNESITKLTFDDNSFRYVLNFDVLEHIPNPEDGLKEIYRVLTKGGKLLLSVPFLPMQQDTMVRARLDSSGGVEHLLEAQYHGDPVSTEGCLCFQDFGWDLLDRMRAIGFVDVNMLLYWSAEYGYYGVEQMIITAKK
jgi:SAM-dependent methyltransferase